MTVMLSQLDKGAWRAIGPKNDCRLIGENAASRSTAPSS